MIELLPSQYKIPPLFEYVRNGFVIFLRKCFAGQYVPDEYKYSTNENETKIKIYNTFPMKIEFFPCMVVTIDNVDFSTQYLQDEFAEGKLEYFGKLEFRINITLKTRTIKDRDRLVDILIFLIRILGKNLFRGLNIEFFKDMRINEESLEIVNSLPVYTTVISFPCYAEYNIKLDERTYETLQSINVTLEELNTFIE